MRAFSRPYFSLRRLFLKKGVLMSIRQANVGKMFRIFLILWILFPYGNGNVFLSAPHPEVSFDDCSLWYDSETWELMNSIISLLIK
jgi:hypothetical protein